MAENCAYCFQDAMDKLWFQQNVLLLEPAGVSMYSLMKRMKTRDATSSPSCSTSLPGKKCSSQENQDKELICKEKRPTRLNIVIGQPLFQLQPPPRKKIQSHTSSPHMHANSQAKSRRRMPRNTMSHRSLSELENYELKGFVDLGFAFPREKLSPQLMSMVPALQRLAEEGVGEEKKRNNSEECIKWPYLSEAWLLRSHSTPHLNLKMLSKSPQGADMKKHLRFWARKVASSLAHQES